MEDTALAKNAIPRTKLVTPALSKHVAASLAEQADAVGFGRATLFNEKETSTFLRRPMKTLQNWRVLGHGPHYIKMGKRVFYRLSDLEAFLNQNLVETNRSL